MAIRWEKDLETALNAARAQDKPIFLDFFHPQ